ncbi:putative ABC-type polysaccharide/polyol phosphate export systems, permease component [Vibrio nigripulchritudo SFn27]|uniref:Transport permease protein n=1 Tax=Vibrio nigripulchritudo TaxID=28173 RepID=U4KHJ3_9VIBR|nr:ABC transporter permease [Vibrio nigripulchritudo]CCN81681.1 putative ABC-type polysaccharide/polyol phosphate export systems, permease component [Vibrio nigripulchritudo BLFn1]CCN91536.1 putative ABC-type polysaccharide/polyol phosphate export systems, permease component [Vibrio nigripulchritudo SFn27]CCN95677.1 putative ABC-type polysaccharide/polyol phosphate export systems, permease component [Vibrio nigripulchritudo ENn2]CCO51172.1 putative ABC-type polysaccharide/polyol phosphate expor
MSVVKLSIAFSKRELVTKYKGSFLGSIWLIASPILLLSLYSAVFQFVFKAKWEIGGESFNFALALFCGLAPYFFLTEMIGKSPELVKNNSNLIKKVVFDRLSVPLSYTLSAAFSLFVNLSLVVVYRIYDTGNIDIVYFVTYLYSVPLLLLGFSIATIFSSIGAYIRDLASIANFINPVLMFVSPVFFDVDKISPLFSDYLAYNPLTPIISGIRGVILEGYFDVSSFLTITLASLTFAVLGLYLFRALEEDFSDLV